jgi:hypothetical protein
MNSAVRVHAAGFIGLPTMFRLTKRIPKSQKRNRRQTDLRAPFWSWATAAFSRFRRSFQDEPAS